MTPEELRERTTIFAVDTIEFCKDFRTRPENRDIAQQLSRSATAVAANYRSASRARSRREFIAKLGIAVEEADESVGWLQIIMRAGLSPTRSADALVKEGKEILAILAASYRTARGKAPDRKK